MRRCRLRRRTWSCGWAIEARVYAEDPARNFLPSIGRLVRYRPPDGQGVRLDAGVSEGAEISVYYDPLIAKLIVSGPDRGAAIDRLSGALDEFYVAGVQHNIPFLAAVAAKPRFRAGTLATNFIAEEFPGGFVAAIRVCRRGSCDPAAAALAGRRRSERERRSTASSPGRGLISPRITLFCSTATHSGFRRAEAPPTASKSTARAASRQPIGSPASR